MVDPSSNEVLADSDPDACWADRCRTIADFEPLVEQRSWYQKLRVLLSQRRSYYQLEQALGTPAGPSLCSACG